MHKIAKGASLAAAVLAASAAPAVADKTTGDYPACGKPFWLEAMVRFEENDQTQSYERYLNHGKCITLRKGLEVEVVRYYGDEDSPRVEFELNGYRFFTVREAVAKAL